MNKVVMMFVGFGFMLFVDVGLVVVNIFDVVFVRFIIVFIFD